MPTELDIFGIKERIRDILQADTTNLYGTNDETKIMKIEAGFPDTEENDEIEPNYIYITNNMRGQNIKNLATGGTAGKKLLDHVLWFDIVVGVTDESSRGAEEKLDDFVKIVLELLEADEKLAGGGSAIVDDSVPLSVRYDGESIGTMRPKAIITLKCVGATA